MGSDLLREVETLSQCSGDYVVKYFDHWIVNNCLYIQMELCSDNLKNIIQQKRLFFGREKTDPMQSIEYFISCHIFKELLECVQYLHDNNIIHRDLNPKNILISEKSINRKYVKICDFGLAKFGDLNTKTHTQGQGTPFYMAPEVITGERYNSKCDIYSLAVIGLELFKPSVFFFNCHFIYFVHNNYVFFRTDPYENTPFLKEKLFKLKKVTSKMISSEPKERPTCRQVLNDIQWMISKREILKFGVKISLKSFRKNFFGKYIDVSSLY